MRRTAGGCRLDLGRRGPSLSFVGRGPRVGQPEAGRRRRSGGEVLTGSGSGRGRPARRDRSRKHRRAATGSVSILRRAAGRPFDRSVRSLPEEISTVRLVPVQVVGNNEGTRPVGAAGSLLLSVACRLSAMAVPVAASPGHVAHEGGREDVVEPPGSGPRFELLCRERHDFRASSRSALGIEIFYRVRWYVWLRQAAHVPPDVLTACMSGLSPTYTDGAAGRGAIATIWSCTAWTRASVTAGFSEPQIHCDGGKASAGPR